MFQQKHKKSINMFAHVSLNLLRSENLIIIFIAKNVNSTDTVVNGKIKFNVTPIIIDSIPSTSPVISDEWEMPSKLGFYGGQELWTHSPNFFDFTHV